MAEPSNESGVGRAKRFWAILLLIFAAVMLIGSVQMEIDLAAVLLVTLPAVVGALLYYTGAREAENARVAAMQRTVLQLAQEDGRLTVTEVATRLGWTMEQSQKVLRSLDDGFRVWTMLSDQGVLVYEFRELVHDPDRPRVAARAEPRVSGDPPPISRPA